MPIFQDKITVALLQRKSAEKRRVFCRNPELSRVFEGLRGLVVLIRNQYGLNCVKMVTKIFFVQTNKL